MFLCAVARPRGDWDGKVGIWPVVKNYRTQRWSRNRPAGIDEVHPVTMTREIDRDMLINDVIPAIKEKWPQAQKGISIRLQQDNAKPHVLENDAAVIAAGCSNGWTMYPLNQPAQSPDLNCLDLSFFLSIQSLQSQTRPRTTEDLIEEVVYAFHETSADTLNKTFLTLQSVMLEIMKCGGSNTYKIPHLHKDKLRNAGKLPITLPCDVQAYWSARAAIMGPFLVPSNQDASDLDVFLY
ncbi:hypothetical protein PF008_g25668 [Phytophthora fragariae]|uniref:Tc1-like transposase DDE domain-containing protein n=1 Tax=Phytophthora fragariae TaxID=53985 RepID=A0A6G0QK23_9STRA|nr:hypothetical protein PF008_g25668 [Phytophthora fragariae]